MKATTARVAAGVVGPAAFASAWLISGAMQPRYSQVGDAISDLAAVGASTRHLMTAGLVSLGVGVPIYATALRRLLPGPGWMTA